VAWIVDNLVPDTAVGSSDVRHGTRVALTLVAGRTPSLPEVFGAYTDWTPLHGRPGLFPEELDRDDPWQFSNVLVR
jgi:homospermidine synthase